MRTKLHGLTVRISPKSVCVVSILCDVLPLFYSADIPGVVASITATTGSPEPSHAIKLFKSIYFEDKSYSISPSSSPPPPSGDSCIISSVILHKIQSTFRIETENQISNP